MSLRRRLIAGVACALAVAIVTVPGHTAKVPRVGFVLTTAPLPTMAGPEPQEIVIRAFMHGMRARGYTEGHNIVIERRSAEGKLARLGDLIRGLVQEPVDVIVVTGNPMTRLAKQITSVIPVVAAGIGAPVESGIVQSLARPNGNVTGLVTLVRPDFVIKRLELIRETLPKASRVAYLGFKADWNSDVMEGVRTAATSMGLTLVLAGVEMPNIQAALDGLDRQGAHALLVSGHPSFFVHRKAIADVAAKIRLPDFHMYDHAVEAGALASCGHDPYDLFHRAAGYVDRILKGARPGDLPLEQIERYSLVVNLKTARMLGLSIPQSVMFRVDRVIE